VAELIVADVVPVGSTIVLEKETRSKNGTVVGISSCSSKLGSAASKAGFLDAYDVITG
jgi:hypothetical protein